MWNIMRACLKELAVGMERKGADLGDVDAQTLDVEYVNPWNETVLHGLAFTGQFTRVMGHLSVTTQIRLA